ncbi:glycosyltransferase family 2 protein [Paenibacillus odorifer]|uniref:glycosyltransferase family 2 protein n=1 Tax=Paenibacillus odorifer TaxID=189426 RepID=UPI002DBDB518|nr:glycosyltransferase [Paenibacillus odorifer]MEC0132117.1 hypothetical protein [Paenibacillus odorifer]MEC0220189.1 hypothetical protein [Paenibacillus odorifer]
MKEADIVFIVLVFRNDKDLIDLIKSVNLKIKTTYKIVVVNSYYDEASKQTIEKVATKYNCDFINVPNRGYGSGNNKGIQFATENYKFEFVVICNPDTEIIKFNYRDLAGKEKNIIAPEIITLQNNKQNPFRLINSKLLDSIKYAAFKRKKYKLIYIDIVINKLAKIFVRKYNNLINKKEYGIYSCHGSFLIIGREAMRVLGELYNEEMFLFSEEDHVAKLAMKKNIVTLMNSNIQILHKEDGSVKFIDSKIMDMIGESFIKYYEYWYSEFSVKENR